MSAECMKWLVPRMQGAGEPWAVWVPDQTHEAVRDLVRTRAAAVENFQRKRQHVTSLLLEHGHPDATKVSWKGRHLRWLDSQSFPHPAQWPAFQKMLNAGRATTERIERLETALIEIVPA